MKNSVYKPLPAKKLPKTDREIAVLMGLVELYLKTGKPIGSSTLQDNGFESLSSATIRNYLSKMEGIGYLKQQHTSGGRIPTEKALRLYVDTYQTRGILESEQDAAIQSLFKKEGPEVAALLHKAAETLSELSQCAVFISTPRFDHDFIQDVRLIELSSSKLLSVVITNFGLIRTETIYLDRPIDTLFLRSCEEYFLWRTNHGEKPLFRDEKEAKLAKKIYNEVMVRHVVGYANFPNEEIFRTGLSKLLSYPEFNDAIALASSLSLLEDQGQMRAILRDCCKKNEMTVWIGNELSPAIQEGSDCSIIAIPYRINQTQAGALALLAPSRMPYRNLFGLVNAFSDRLSSALTDIVYRHKITFRQADNLQAQPIVHSSILLENQGLKND